MPFLPQGKTNWKFLLIVAVLAVIVGGVLGYVYFLWSKQPVPFSDNVKIEVPERIKDETPKLKYEVEYPDLENFEGDGDYYHWFLAKEPKVEIYSPSEFIECSKVERELSSPALLVLLEEFIVNDISYFLCISTEGAAGTAYITYYAITTKDEEQFVLSLTIGEQSCWAHGSPHDPESQFQACEEEYQKAEERLKELIVQILSTLRFIEGDETADWKPYNSRQEVMGISLGVPSGWKVNYKKEKEATTPEEEAVRLGQLRTTFDLAPPSWGISSGIGWMGWGEFIIDIYSYQTGADEWIAEYLPDYKDKLKVEEIESLGGKPTFLLSSASEDVFFTHRYLVLGDEYSYVYGFSQDGAPNFTQRIKEEIFPHINIK